MTIREALFPDQPPTFRGELTPELYRAFLRGNLLDMLPEMGPDVAEEIYDAIYDEQLTEATVTQGIELHEHPHKKSRWDTIDID